MAAIRFFSPLGEDTPIESVEPKMMFHGDEIFIDANNGILEVNLTGSVAFIESVVTRVFNGELDIFETAEPDNTP